METRRVYRDYKELRKIGRPGVKKDDLDIAPAGVSPMLRASWKFARKWADRFNQELTHEKKGRVRQFLKALARNFNKKW